MSSRAQGFRSYGVEWGCRIWYLGSGFIEFIGGLGFIGGRMCSACRACKLDGWCRVLGSASLGIGGRVPELSFCMVCCAFVCIGFSFECVSFFSCYFFAKFCTSPNSASKLNLCDPF